MTHTVATLEISEAAFREIADKLRAAGYQHLFMADNTIDMYGIGLARAPVPAGTHATMEIVLDQLPGVNDYV